MHHIVPVVDGGDTTVDQLANVCHWDHHLITHCGWTISGQPNARVLTPPPRANTDRAPP